MRPFRSPSPARRCRAITLVEVTLVLSVLLALVGVLFIGTRAYRKGTDRALCLQNLATLQKAVRAYGNLHQLVPGNTVPNLKDELIGPDKFLPAAPVCPAQGIYTYRGDTLPQVGELYLSCSAEGHYPRDSAAW